MNIKQKLSELSTSVHKVLIEYIDIHNNFLKEYGTIGSLFKTLFGTNFNILSESKELALILMLKWDKIYKEIIVFCEEFDYKLTEDEKKYLETLKEYTLGLKVTIGCLLKLIDFLVLREQYFTDGKKQMTTRKEISWKNFNIVRGSYKIARSDYMQIGLKLNILQQKLFR